MRKAGHPAAVFHWQESGGRSIREARIEDVLCGEKRVTAIFSSNDFGAIELLDCADRLGKRVPQDLSIVGFDDVTLAGLARINLTTVAQPKEMMARLAVNTLAARVEGELQGASVRQIVDCNLIVRGSTALCRDLRARHRRPKS
jgi:DNA-binding LacI/PurR family transcriptional regulator